MSAGNSAESIADRFLQLGIFHLAKQVDVGRVTESPWVRADLLNNLLVQALVSEEAVECLLAFLAAAESGGYLPHKTECVTKSKHFGWCVIDLFVSEEFEAGLDKQGGSIWLL